MEEWQKQHIQANIVGLIKSTTCTTGLLKRLNSAKILSLGDVEELNQLSPFENSKKLYEILQTRPGSYEILLHSLRETDQMNAVSILETNNALVRSSGSILYDTSQVLGTGSSGTIVFKGIFSGNNVAVKVVNVDLTENDVSLREVEMLKHVDGHENVVRYFTYERSENLVHIAIELCTLSLHDEIRFNVLNLDPVYILESSTKGLSHLHKNHVVHGDMKPANILLSDNKQVKISDFGLSKKIPTGMTGVSLHLADVGTPDWMAPEVLKVAIDDTATGKVIRVYTSADVFSLGCIFYFVLTKGSHPIGDSLLRKYNICCNKPQIQSLVMGDQWKQLIREMISFEASRRPSCETILSSECFQHGMNENDSERSPSSNSTGDVDSRSLSVYSLSSPANYTPVDHTVRKETGNNGVKTFDSAKKQQNNSTFFQIFSSNAGFIGSLKITIQCRTDVTDTDSDAQPIVSTILKEQTLGLVICGGDDMKLERNGEEPVLHLPAAEVVHRGGGASSCGLKIFVSCTNFDKPTIRLAGGSKGDLCCKVHDTRTNSNTIVPSSSNPRHLEEANKFMKLDSYRRMCLDCGLSVIQIHVDKGGVQSLYQIIYPPPPEGPRHHDTCIVDNKMFNGTISIEEALKQVRENKLDVNTADAHGNNFLLFATASGVAMEILEEIVQHGVDWQARNRSGRTVLHHAASCGNVDALKYFISLGVDVDILDGEHRTALLLAERTQKHFIETVKFLMETGLSINAVDKNGNSLFLLAISRGKALWELQEIVRLGGDWKARNQKGETVLHLSAAQGDIEALQYFISLGADAAIRDVGQQTAGHRALLAKSNVKESLKLLVENGMDVNAVDKDGHDLLLLGAAFQKPKTELEYILMLMSSSR